MALSTVQGILTRIGLGKLSRLDPPAPPTLTVPADSEQQAMDEAANRYQRVRQAALLPAEPARIIGVFGPPVGAPRDDQLLTEASNLLEAGHPEMAVVAMQTACELLAKDVLETLAARAGVSKKALRTPVTLQDHPTRAILFLAMGERIERQHWWRDYVAHWERRRRWYTTGSPCRRSRRKNHGRQPWRSGPTCARRSIRATAARSPARVAG
jgi:hypothetical protein